MIDPIAAATTESRRWSESDEFQFAFRWCVPLTEALESKCKGLAWRWMYLSCKTLLEQSPSPNRDRLLEDVAFLGSAEVEAASFEQLAEKCGEIWYRKPLRDEAQTAVSKFYNSYLIYRGHPDKIFRPDFQSPIDLFVFGFGPRHWDDGSRSRQQIVFDQFTLLMREGRP